MSHHTPKSKEDAFALLAKLNNLVYAYCGSKIDWTDFSTHGECFQTIKSLRSNKNILITKPDKGSEVVILNYTDYTAKMELILRDKTNFRLAEENDNTAKIKIKLQNRLLPLKKDDQLTSFEYESIRRTGSQRPRMYGFPRVHKPFVPPRPILSMIGSSQHELAKWLSILLQPVLHRYPSRCIKDSFTFVETIQKLATKPDETFTCSFDIAYLFTNIPLAEAIQICTDYLYDTKSTNTLGMEKYVFVELMNIATTSVEFNFDNVAYKQTDGAAMGSPLGPATANIFIGYYEKKLFNGDNEPIIYFRYMTLLLCLKKKLIATCFLINSIHYAHHQHSLMKRKWKANYF